MTTRGALLLAGFVSSVPLACSDSGDATPQNGAGSGPTAGTMNVAGSNAGTTSGGSASGGSSGASTAGSAGSNVTGGGTSAGAGGTGGNGGASGGSGGSGGGVPLGPVKPVMRDGKWAFDFNDVTFEVDPMVGGRITTFKLGATNLLVSSTDTMNQYYWGSTLWVSPEATKWTQPPPAELDANPYTATATDTSVTMTSAAYAKLGITITKTFSVDTKLAAVVIEYKLNNTTQATEQMAPWEVTRVFPKGLTFFPKGPTAPTLSMGATLTTSETSNIIWFNYDGPSITKDSKLYADGAEGWVAHVADGVVFIKSFADVTADKLAPKEGDVELYVNTDHPDIKRYIEIEDQGAYGDVAANASMTWTCTWFLRKLPAGVDATPGSAALAQFVRDTIAGK
ncbi:MAG TPA: DUF4380 domain-containing protein [Polyangiaceae bacterium]|nr:DUF4380 domain-containing protein [Polyangiaceae bacterium]